MYETKKKQCYLLTDLYLSGAQHVYSREFKSTC